MAGPQILYVRVVLLALATSTCLVAVACGGSSDPSSPGTAAQASGNGARATVPSSASEAPAARATPGPAFTFKASGTHKSKPFFIELPARIDYTFTGRGNFIASVEATDGSGTIGQVANIIGSYKTTTWIYGGDEAVRAYLDVIADGKYTVKVTSNAKAAAKAVPVKFTGRWGLETTPFSASSDVNVTYSHKGDGNFIVDVIDVASGGSVDSVANEIGHVSSETSLYGLDGEYAFEVIADGSWTLSVSKQ